MSRLATGPRAFFYFAATAKGGRTLGVRSCPNERSLAAALRRDRLVLLRAWGLPEWLSVGESRLKLKDHSALNNQLGVLLSRGVPLVEALEVAASVVSSSSRSIVDRLRESVSGGASFADACAQTGQFDEVAIAVYRAAERSGDLDGATQRLAGAAQRRMQIQQQVVTVMIYPIIVVTIAVGVTSFLLTYVVPQIGKVLRQSPAEIPLYTKAVLSAGDFMQANWLWVLLGAIASGVIVFGMRRTIGPLAWAVVRRAPLVKDVLRTQDAARFFEVMAAMTRAGVPLADALGVGVQAVGDKPLHDQLATLRRRLIDGGVLRTLIDGVTTLPLATRRLLVAADRAGDLESAFTGLAEETAADLQKQTQRLLGVLEPAVIVGMFLVIGALVLSLMVPLLSVSQNLG
ncbi:MAG: type II secretion system F family protein [Planctomycetota bacterium]